MSPDLPILVCAASAVLGVLIVVNLIPDRRWMAFFLRVPMVSLSASMAAHAYLMTLGACATPVDIWRDASILLVMLMIWLVSLDRRL